MSSSTLIGQVEFGPEAIAQMRRAEEEAEARRLKSIAEGMAAKCEEFARMQVASSDEFAGYAARCDALVGALPKTDLAREHEAIVNEARTGDRSAAAARVSELERRAAHARATTISQQVLAETILKRAGNFVVKAKDGNTLKGSLDLGNNVRMPMEIVAVPPSQEGGPTRHEVVFKTAESSPGSCLEQHEAARRIARAAGPELRLNDTGDERPKPPARKGKRKKQIQEAKVNKTRRAG